MALTLVDVTVDVEWVETTLLRERYFTGTYRVLGQKVLLSAEECDDLCGYAWRGSKQPETQSAEETTRSASLVEIVGQDNNPSEKDEGIEFKRRPKFMRAAI